ncbi:MAG: hypothetical protein R3D68_17225 [Hyphomicrobiaceae bacterium]
MQLIHGRGSKPGRRVWAVAVGVPMLVAGVTLATASPVSTLSGSWGGSGRITYTDGSTEGINCSAYYSGGSSELKMAIQCRSDRNPIHIRSQLRISGSRATGTWEERTFNASGSASGSITGNNMSLKVSGGGFNGTMSVHIGQSSHTVNITTQGIAMRSATMNFSKR